ncbi:MAG: NUDIX domain-containing protein [Streptosporangiaceae bacterium]
MPEDTADTARPVNPRVSGFLPPDEYVASLARKRMAAGALFRDEDGRVLLVDPVYRDTWDLPGGAVEAEESPHAACRREVAEELGLDRPPGRVLAVDWVPSRPNRPEGLIVVYDGGTLSPAEISTLAVSDSELAGFAFVPPSVVATRVTPLVGSRISACLDAVAQGLVLSLEAGRPG